MYKYIIINIINNKLKCSNQTELSYTFREGAILPQEIFFFY